MSEKRLSGVLIVRPHSRRLPQGPPFNDENSPRRPLRPNGRLVASWGANVKIGSRSPHGVFSHLFREGGFSRPWRFRSGTRLKVLRLCREV